MPASVATNSALSACRSIESTDDVERLAERLLPGLGAPYVLAGNTIKVGASIGVALFPEHGDTAEALITHADEALYLSLIHI